MKILIIDNGVINKVGGGCCTNSFNGAFLEELVGLGHRVTYTQLATEMPDSINVFDIRLAGADCYPLRLCRSKVLSYIVAYLKLLFLIPQYDFVYLYYPNTFKYVAFICKLLGKKYGVYIRGMQDVQNKISSWIYKNAFVVLTVSDYFTEMVDKITQKSKSYTIRPMIPYKVTDIITGREYEQKSQYNLLYLGRMNAQKGLVELLHAARILKDRDRFNFELHLVGGGEFSEQVKAEISHLGLADVVFFKGAIYDDAEKMQCYRQSDLYVLPTYHEGFPRTLYEAMIAGTPIVTTFVGGISSVMRDGVNCLRIEPRSVESIVDVLSLALANYQDMGRLATNGRETVRRILQRKSHAQLLNDVLMDTKDDMRAV